MSARREGSVVAAGSFVVAALAIWGVTSGEKWVAIGEILTHPPIQHLDVFDWSYHWRTSAILSLVLALLGIASGFLIYSGRRSGLILLAAIATAKLSYDIVAFALGFARYTFESPHNISSVFLIAIIAWALYRYAHWPKPTTGKGDA
jgi:hypothetical protein